jgi:hypothetical protein
MSVSNQVRANLLSIVAVYRRATGKRLSAVSRRFYGNAAFLKEYSRGRQSISLDKLDNVLDNLRKEWPENAVWPFTGAIFMDREDGAGK